MGILEKPLGKFSAFIQNNNFTSAIVRGITISIPVTIVGGLATLITRRAGSCDFRRGKFLLWRTGAVAKSGAGESGHICHALVNNVTMNMLFSLLSVSDYVQFG